MLLARQTRENTAIQRILEQLEQGIFREVSGNFRTRAGTYQALQGKRPFLAHLATTG